VEQKLLLPDRSSSWSVTRQLADGMKMVKRCDDGVNLDVDSY